MYKFEDSIRKPTKHCMKKREKERWGNENKKINNK
jgi:hypothetical protein